MPGEPVGQVSASPLAAATPCRWPRSLGQRQQLWEAKPSHARTVAQQTGQQCHGPASGPSTPGGAAGGEP